MFIAFVGLMIGLILFIFGISAFIQFKYLNFASSYWDKKRLKKREFIKLIKEKNYRFPLYFRCLAYSPNKFRYVPFSFR